MKQRIHFVDVAKGMLILMVIATHIDGITSNSGLDTKKLWIMGGVFAIVGGASSCKHSSYLMVLLLISESLLSVF